MSPSSNLPTILPPKNMATKTAALTLAPATVSQTLAGNAAQLARELAYSALANAQNTASLNFNAARVLLVHSRIPSPGGAEMHVEQWRNSWRSFEVCATSADQILNLAQVHAERTTAGLRKSGERLLDDIASTQTAWQADQTNALRSAFDALQEAQAAYWRLTQQTLSALVQLAQAPTTTPAPAHAPTLESSHGTH